MGLHPLIMSRNGFRALSSRFRNQMFSMTACRSQELKDACNEDEVIFESLSGGRAVINLNRPKQLNTLNASMVKKIRETLLKWKDDKYLILIKGSGEKAFCAGGDVVAVTKDQTGEVGKQFFKEEYKLDALIASLKIPVASVITGIVMGGGVGISRFGKIRVATETSMFAMPETQIGFFPDVGVSYHLARMPNHLGDFLALTGYRLKGYDLVHAGIASHFCTTSRLKELEDALLRDFSKAVTTSPEAIFQEFHEESLKSFKDGPPPFSLAEHTDALNTWFSSRQIDDVFNKLSTEKSKFAEETLECLKKMSPLSLRVTHRQIKEAANLDIYQCFNIDYRIALNMLKNGDFAEGVRALLVDKDKKPKWKHPSVGKVTDAEVDKFFCPLEPGHELDLPESLYLTKS